MTFVPQNTIYNEHSYLLEISIKESGYNLFICEAVEIKMKNTAEYATEQGFCCLESFRETTGAWNAGFCCFEHMVLYFDHGPTNIPVVRNEECYKRVLAEQAARKAQIPLDKLRLQREADRDESHRKNRMIFSKTNSSRRKSLNKIRHNTEPSAATVPPFLLTGKGLKDTISRHRHMMRTNQNTKRPTYTIVK
jgi:hypothetical protein